MNEPEILLFEGKNFSLYQVPRTIEIRHNYYFELRHNKDNGKMYTWSKFRIRAENRGILNPQCNICNLSGCDDEVLRLDKIVQLLKVPENEL